MRKIESEVEYDQISYPVISKPIGSAGTDNVTVCKSKAELEFSLQTIFNSSSVYGGENTEALIQEYMQGQEYMVDSVSCDGYHKILLV